MGSFAYDPGVLTAFPATRGAVVYATGLNNGPAPRPLQEAYLDTQRRVRARIGETPLSEIPSLAAWRRVFAGFGAQPTKYRSAAEALARRLTKQGSIPSVNLLVDIANLVSIRYALPVAVFDQSAVTGSTTVRSAEGTERFTDLGTVEISAPEIGEVIFSDEAGLVSARRWCWRQSAQSAASTSTAEAVITIEGQHVGADDDLTDALDDLSSLLREFQPGMTLRAARLGPGNPKFDW